MPSGNERRPPIRAQARRILVVVFHTARRVRRFDPREQPGAIGGVRPALAQRVRLIAQRLREPRAIAKAPELTVKMFLRTLRRLANPLVEHSLAEESVAQSLVFASDDTLYAYALPR